MKNILFSYLKIALISSIVVIVLSFAEREGEGRPYDWHGVLVTSVLLSGIISAFYFPFAVDKNSKM